MAMFESIAESKKAYGLSPGDVVSAPIEALNAKEPLVSPILCYVGIRKGLPRWPEPEPYGNGKVLVFQSALPILEDFSDYFYLLINPESKPENGKYNILECKVEDLKKIGNLSHEFWVHSTICERDILRNIRIDAKKTGKRGCKTTNLYNLLQAYSERKDIPPIHILQEKRLEKQLNKEEILIS